MTRKNIGILYFFIVLLFLPSLLSISCENTTDGYQKFNITFNEEIYLRDYYLKSVDGDMIIDLEADPTTLSLSDYFILTPLEKLGIGVNYQLYLNFSDFFGNFEIDDSVCVYLDLPSLSIELIEPPNGVSDNVTGGLSSIMITTDRDAFECVIYNPEQDLLITDMDFISPTSFSASLPLQNYDDVNKIYGNLPEYEFICKEGSPTNYAIASKIYNIGYDLTSPIITVSHPSLLSTPYIKIDIMSRIEEGIKDDEVLCRFDEKGVASNYDDMGYEVTPNVYDYKKEFSLILDHTTEYSLGFDPAVYELDIICINRAGLESNKIELFFNVTNVDFQITEVIVQNLSSSNHLNTEIFNATIYVNPSEEGTECYIENLDDSNYKIIGTDTGDFVGLGKRFDFYSEDFLIDGDNELKITCDSGITYKTATRSIDILLDATPPSISGIIVANDTICSDTFEVKVVYTEDYPSEIYFYLYTLNSDDDEIPLTYNGDPLVYNVDDDPFETTLIPTVVNAEVLMLGGNGIVIKARMVDESNNWGEDLAVNDDLVYDPTSDVCKDLMPPETSLDYRYSSSNLIIDLECTDLSQNSLEKAGCDKIYYVLTDDAACPTLLAEYQSSQETPISVEVSRDTDYKKYICYFSTDLNGNREDAQRGDIDELFIGGLLEDADSDGHLSDEDCDDTNPSVWQWLTGYKDSDGDGYTYGDVQLACSGNSLASGYRTYENGEDCNDDLTDDSSSICYGFNFNVHPPNCGITYSMCAYCVNPDRSETSSGGQEYTCFDDVNNDCDGGTDCSDEDCSEYKEFFGPDQLTCTCDDGSWIEGCNAPTQGICIEGQKICYADTWGECEAKNPLLLPFSDYKNEDYDGFILRGTFTEDKEEVCDDLDCFLNGQWVPCDEDCDGASNCEDSDCFEFCSCTPNTYSSCGVDEAIGICEPGIAPCGENSNGQWVLQGCYEKDESNNLDLTKPTVSIGQFPEDCSDDDWDDEDCDGYRNCEDSDCFTSPECYVGCDDQSEVGIILDCDENNVNVCGAITKECLMNPGGTTTWSVCSGTTKSGSYWEKGINQEVCDNGLDDDCDGDVDEFCDDSSTVPGTGDNETEIPGDSTDSDGDGIPDWWEEENGLDPNDPTDARDDNDNDGSYNIEEYENDTDPNNPDTDGDGIYDGGEETSNTDPLHADDTPPDLDEDGIDDNWEFTYCEGGDCDPDADDDHDGLTTFEEYIYNGNPNDYDSDGDGLSDGEEVELGTDVDNDDTDGDGWVDGAEVHAGTDPLDPNDKPKDDDNDGMADNWELDNGLDPTDPRDANFDKDGDGLINILEFILGSDPNDDDSDDDGFLDGGERTSGTDPTNPESKPIDLDGDKIDDLWEEEFCEDGDCDPESDVDKDGLNAFFEYNYNTDPTLADADGDGLDDGDEYENNTDPNDSDTDDDNSDDGDEIKNDTDPLDSSDYKRESEIEKESNLLAWILLILGLLLIISGFSYLNLDKIQEWLGLKVPTGSSLPKTPQMYSNQQTDQKPTFFQKYVPQAIQRQTAKIFPKLKPVTKRQKISPDKSKYRKDLLSKFDSSFSKSLNKNLTKSDGIDNFNNVSKEKAAAELMEKIANEKANNLTKEAEINKKLEGLTEDEFEKLEKLVGKDEDVFAELDKHIGSRKLSQKEIKKDDDFSKLDKLETKTNLDEVLEKNKKKKSSIDELKDLEK